MGLFWEQNIPIVPLKRLRGSEASYCDVAWLLLSVFSILFSKLFDNNKLICKEKQTKLMFNECIYIWLRYDFTSNFLAQDNLTSKYLYKNKVISMIDFEAF